MNKPTATNSYLIPFILVCSLFFLWGIANSLNGSLIKHFQTALDLSRAQAGIVDSAFYIGYFVMAIPAGLFMQRFGYKNGILIGLLLYAVGALLFYPAANVRVYGFFLSALFIIASGLGFLETAANLYVSVLGDPETGARRVNFAQMFNGISIILGPIIGSAFIFSKTEITPDDIQKMPFEQAEATRQALAQSVQMPYLVVGGVVLFVALLFWLTKMPEVGSNQASSTEGVATVGQLLRHRHLVWGVIAQFFYVGAQASLWGYFVDFKLDLAKDQHIGLVNSIYQVNESMTPTQIAGFHASAALVLFMLGRFIGTALMQKMAPERVLTLFTVAATALVGIAMLTGGMTAVTCIMLVYFFMSIMFPTIFALATKGMSAQEGKLASSLVIMAIVGGAILPPIMGLLFKSGVSAALIVPLVSLLVILFFAVKGHKVTMNY